MKKFNKYIALGLGFGALALTSCDGLDTENMGSYVTPEDKESVTAQDPDQKLAAVTGTTALFSTYESVYAYHFDFGYPAIMLGLDLQGNDMGTTSSGYNWFSYWESFSSPTASGTPSSMAWYHMYDQILACNTVCADYKDATEDLDLFMLAQARALRAFDYWVLAQLYQFNYAGNESKPCVPIITENNMVDVQENGAPRATVQEVYDQIFSDINSAIEILDNNSYTPDDLYDNKAKRAISVAVAYGLRARFYLTQHKYAQAGQDAQTAISKFSGSPYTISEVSKPSFSDLDDNSWMWGIAISENDRVVTSGIVNWPSMVVTFCGNGYVSVGAWKFMASDLYAQIPRSDVRKGWFLDENFKSKNLSSAQQKYVNSLAATMFDYTNVKFDSYKGVVAQTTNANDIPLMRIEEMYYILAESQVMTGNIDGGLQTFTDFVSRYRDVKFTKPTAATAEEAQNIIYQDRRVEFWGEGLSWFDMMRLGIGVDRLGATNMPPSYVFQIPCDPELGKPMIYCIPQAEITSNPAISSQQNNPEGEAPTPV